MVAIILIFCIFILLAMHLVIYKECRYDDKENTVEEKVIDFLTKYFK